MNELLTKLKVFGHVLWVLWTVGLGYLLMNTPITNPILCLVAYLTPIVVVKVIWWILPARWKIKESIVKGPG